jgi:CelD/BcsL family acetyltransferase involved in cellulose biosynthesis
VRIEEVTSAERLAGLAGEWRALYERCPAATPFQSPEWVLAWLAQIYRGGDIWALAVREDEALLALAPLFIHRNQQNPALRQVSFLGAGISDYLDILATPVAADTAARRILAHLAEHSDRWDICDLRELRPDSALLRISVPDSLETRTLETDTCPVLKLPRTTQEFSEQLDAKFRKNLHYYRQRLSRHAQIGFETAKRETVDEFVDALLRLHQARWQLRGEAGVLATAALGRFHHAVAASFVLRGNLRMHALRVASNIVAVAYGFHAHGRVFYYLGGFDPQFEQFSVGNLVIQHSIESAILEGAEEYDFLRKGERYKYRWGARDRFNRRLLLSPQRQPLELIA